MNKKQLISKTFWKGKKVLITGHTGFKGSWMSLWLSELGASITGVGLEPKPEKNIFTQLNITKRLSSHHIANTKDYKTMLEIVECSQPDIVIHMAAQALVRESYKNPRETWETNVQGTINLLEATKTLRKPCATVIVTTDKVYENKEWDYGYRESDRLGGNDPYSASKASAEIAVSSWRSSFCGIKSHQNPYIAVATARSGNVIGGGDWSEDRIVPDIIRALSSNATVKVRNPSSTRPWQHVLEPLSGYLTLAQALHAESDYNANGKEGICSAFNFGPHINSNRSVQELINESFKHWPGTWQDLSEPNAPHEAQKLHLQIDKAHHHLGWSPKWCFEETVKHTIDWYNKVINLSLSAEQCCMSDLESYQSSNSGEVQ